MFIIYTKLFPHVAHVWYIYHALHMKIIGKCGGRQKIKCHKRYWTNLFHRNVWQDQGYLVRKRAALRQDTRRRNYVYHRRDLMPKCVLVLVRSWFNKYKKTYTEGNFAC
jgi:hypothetical protein